MRSRKLTHRPLVLSLQMALALSLPSVGYADVVVPPASTTDITGTTYTSATTDGFALGATGSGTQATGSGVSATATGVNGAAVIAIDSAVINLSDSQFDAAGPSSIAVFAHSGARIDLTRPTILASGSEASGVAVIDGRVNMTGGSIVVSRASGNQAIFALNTGLITSTDQQIETHGEDTEGVRAEGGGKVMLTRGSVLVDGFDAYGLYSLGSPSMIDVNGTSITAQGEAEAGAVAQDGGSIVLQGATVTADILTSEGDALRALDAGSSIVAHDTDVVTHGTKTYGVYARTGGVVQLDTGSTVSTTGDDAFALYATDADSRLVANDTTITTSGAGAVGVFAELGSQALLGAGTSVTTSNSRGTGIVALNSPTQIVVDAASIVTSGDNAPAAVAVDGGFIKFGSGASATANGLDSNAVEVIGAGSRIEATSATLTSATAAGVVMSQGADAQLVDTAITAKTHAIGATVIGTTPTPDTPATVTVSGGSLASDQSAIYVGGGAIAQVGLDNGATVTSGENLLAYTAATSKLALTLAGVDITGDAFAETGSTLDIALQDASTLHGMVTNGNMMSLVAGATWNMTGDSDVGSLANAGTIAFATPTAADFKTLTVRGDYTGNGGTLALNTVLGGDASQTDKLVVQGNTSGTTNVAINNVGGAGAQTVNGIQVVQVAGTSDGIFSLSGRAVAGAYEYSLLKGGVSTPTDGAWYLRSQVVPPVVPPVVEPPVVEPPVVVPPVPAAPSTPLYRPEAAVYLANQATAVGMFRHSMHDRMGDPNFSEKANDDGSAPAVWARVVRNQMDGTAGFDQLDVSTDTSLFQVGGELARWSGDSRFHLGAMGGTGSANSLADSNLTAYHAKGKVTGYNLGVYGTWFADAAEPTGLYVDGWLQYGRYHDRVLGDYLSPERYSAWTLSASAEAGYAFALNDGGNTRFFIEPQAQVIYTDYSSHTHEEYNGTYVNDIDAGGLTTRLGLRFYGHASADGGNRVQPFATLNWWHDDDANVMSFNDHALKLFLPRNQYELKLGAQTQLGGGWTGWGNLGLVSGDGDYRDVNGQIGANYRW